MLARPTGDSEGVYCRMSYPLSHNHEDSPTTAELSDFSKDIKVKHVALVTNLKINAFLFNEATKHYMPKHQNRSFQNSYESYKKEHEMFDFHYISFVLCS